ncbi:TPA: hypothetical protein ACFRG5_002082, partial [Neisseria lactamica]
TALDSRLRGNDDSGIFDDSDSAKQAVKRFGVFMMRQIRISLSAKTATPLGNGEIDGDTGGNENGGSGGLKPILHPSPTHPLFTL